MLIRMSLMDKTHIPDFELLDHTADLGIVVRGADLKELFQAAASAMTQIMTRSRSDGEVRFAHLQVTGNDLPDLLVRWLGEILYLFEVEHVVTVQAQIEAITPLRLEARVGVRPFDPAQDEVLCDIKAVTYHQAAVERKGSRWEARIIFDL